MQQQQQTIDYDAIPIDIPTITLKDCCKAPLQVMKMYVCTTKFVELIGCIIVGAVLTCTPHIFLPLLQRPIPYQITAANDILLDLTKNQEWVGETVPSILLLFISFLMPLSIQIIISFYHGAVDDTHCTICVYVIATGLAIGVTEALKNYVGYLRPNFYNRCIFSDDTLACTGDEEFDAMKSFPSGHSSLSFCSMTTLTLYLLRIFGVGGLKCSQGNKEATSGRRLISMLCLLPMTLCFFVAASRVHDNYHHPADVVAGALIGWGCARVVYNIW